MRAYGWPDWTTGYESDVYARVRDGNGKKLATAHFMSGANGAIDQFQTVMELEDRPTTPGGFVEVYDENGLFPNEGPYGGQVEEFQKVIVPVVFGENLVDGYLGFTYHVVLHGETLSKIARDVLGDAGKWPAIYEANRDQIGDPNLIFSGQRLRLPRS